MTDNNERVQQKVGRQFNHNPNLEITGRPTIRSAVTNVAANERQSQQDQSEKSERENSDTVRDSTTKDDDEQQDQPDDGGALAV